MNSGETQTMFTSSILRAKTTADDIIYMPVGYIKQMAAVLSEQEKERRGLYFAGEYVSGPHTGAACASGRSIAQLIKKHWV